MTKPGIPYVLTKDRFEHKKDTVVYYFGGNHYGLISEDSRRTGIEHVAVTLNKDGKGEFFTVPYTGIMELHQQPEAEVDPWASSAALPGPPLLVVRDASTSSMTMRQYYAAHAPAMPNYYLSEVIQKSGGWRPGMEFEAEVKWAWKWADAMLEASK